MPQPNFAKPPKVTVSLVTWNSEPFVLGFLKSLFQQTMKDFQLIVVDNASKDATLERIRSEYPQVKVLRHQTNLGFGRGHNLAISISKAPFVFIANPDILLAEDYLARMIQALEADPSLGSVQGKLRRFSFSQEDDLRQPVRSDILDSTGLLGTKNRSFIDRGEGEEDKGQYDAQRDIFGPTGACAVYRREALLSVQYHREFFDEAFFAYVEDSDLAWRLQNKKWGSRFVPEAIAWHYRTVRSERRPGEKMANRQLRSLANRRRAAANALSIRIKNLDSRTFWRNAWRIIGYEMMKAGYLIVREPTVLPAYIHFFRLLPSMLQKRRIIRRQCSADIHTINRFFTA